MRLYLDTSMIWSWFRKNIEGRRKKIPFKIPSVIKFVSSQPELELVLSSLTKLEIFRFLKSEWDCSDNEAEDIWESFLKTFNISYLISKEIDYEELIKICGDISTKKKTVVNLIHLQIAKKNGLKFLTGEEKLKKKYKKYYDNILTYKDIRKHFA